MQSRQSDSTTPAPALGRVLKSADFERVLATPSCARSQHFAVHHLADLAGPAAVQRARTYASVAMKEKQGPSSEQVTPSIGTVIPKRHARSAVTRSLLKRQIRAAMRTPLCANLYPGMWVVRLRAPFDRKSHPSAASQALRAAARDELATVIGDAMKRINS